MFDLETAISTWRHVLKHDRAFFDEDLDELERRVRDQVDSMIARGETSEEKAFRRAIKQMGDLGSVTDAYRDVYWQKARHRRVILDEAYWKLSMLRNYLRIALRVIYKQKLYAAVNVFGLAIGLACFMLIVRYVQYELSYDRFHENSDRVNRAVFHSPGDLYLGTDYYAGSPALLASTLLDEYPEVTSATAIRTLSGRISYGDENHDEAGIWADGRFFSVFPFKMLQGDPETALSEPGAIVLTVSLAEKIFGSVDPIGKTLTLQSWFTLPMTVTGVVEDVPENAHFSFRFVTSILSSTEYQNSTATPGQDQLTGYTYFELQEGVSAREFESRMAPMAERFLVREDLAEGSRFVVQPLTSIHLNSHLNFEITSNGYIKYVYILSGIALAILLLACMNYMNLAIARSVKRAGEVGMRKVVGAYRRQLMGQFLGESVLMVLVAMVLAVAITLLVLPAFGQFFERDLSINPAESGIFLLSLVGLTLVVGVISGSYPALFMSKLRPAHVLKSSATVLSGRVRLRSLLIVAQYAISIMLVVGSLTIYQQMEYIQNVDVGYDRDQVVSFRIDPGTFEATKAELLQKPSVVSVTKSRFLPTNVITYIQIQGWEGSAEDETLTTYFQVADYDFTEVYSMEIVAGRTFSLDHASDDAGAFLFNETALRTLGWDSETALGKYFDANGDRTGRVVGIVKDFNMHSLHAAIEPLLIFLNPRENGVVAVKISTQDLPATLASIESTVLTHSSRTFSYRFLDDVFNSQYRAEIKQGKLFGIFTLLALGIASLGLFGMAAFTAEQRQKEIGVRKVLGASVRSIVLLISREFSKLVAIGFVLAAPVIYLIMNQWLDGFAYRIVIGPVIFVVALSLVTVIAWLAVSYQAIRAARANPVESIMYE